MYSSLARVVALSSILAAHGAFAAEPIVVLKSPSAGMSRGTSGNNEFVRNPDFSAKHKVKPNESLSHIIKKYYGDSSLNRKFLELAIVSRNSHAFVRGNPHFLFAGRTLHLPSVNEIRDMIYGKSSSKNTGYARDRADHIYFNGF